MLETSSNLLLTASDGYELKANLAMATVELSSMTVVGRMFCATCYRVEGDSPLMLTMYLILEKLEETIEAGHDVTLVEKIVDDCVAPLAKAMNPLIDRASAAEEEVTATEEHQGTAK